MIEQLTRAEYDALLRQDFMRFVERCFYELNPQAELALNWHLDVIAAKLTAVREGKIRRLIINKPYIVDNIECIFHPSARERAIAVCRRQQGGMKQRLRTRPVEQECEGRHEGRGSDQGIALAAFVGSHTACGTTEENP